MTVKEYLKKKRIPQVEAAAETGVPMVSLNLYLNEWKPMPEIHISRFAKYLGISEDEVRNNKVRKV